MKSKLLCVLLLSWGVIYAQEAGSQNNPPTSPDGVAQQQQNQAPAPETSQPSAPPQGGDFSNNWDAPKVPAGVILVKGAWASASDSITPLPEGGGITDKVYKNDYFGLSYSLPADWYQKFAGPPPSDSGSYVLLQLRPTETFKGTKGTALVTAQDLFFSMLPGKNALELANYSAKSLRSDYTLEKAPEEITLARRSFVRMAYASPAAGLHWYVLSTEIRCHALQFVFISRDTQLLDRMVQSLDKMTLPEEAGAITGTGGGKAPVCVKNYAGPNNVVNRVEPVLPDHKYNPIPVRIIIGKNGKVTHVHMISAFPDQAKIITDALLQWEFKPYLVNGEPAEVETGIMFGLNPRPQRKAATKQSNPVSD
ncbi:MAG TPA: hypothetical protein VKW06_10665 [Candidatus Angelobacter sp.]|nr:hypothetical protein [Candidatus Angelobacter sp.]